MISSLHTVLIKNVETIGWVSAGSRNPVFTFLAEFRTVIPFEGNEVHSLQLPSGDAVWLSKFASFVKMMLAAGSGYRALSLSSSLLRRESFGRLHSTIQIPDLGKNARGCENFRHHVYICA